MKLKFDTYPLNIYGQSNSQSLLDSINRQIPNSKLSHVGICQSILSSFVSKAAGAGLLSLIDSASIGLKGQKARICLTDLIKAQTKRINHDTSLLLKETQINLMTTSCITDNLSSLECGSWDNGAKNIGKAVLGLFSFKNPLETICESVKEISTKYDDICLVYHIAFLLNVYNENPSTKELIISLIVEALSKDSEGQSSFSTKERFVLFSDARYKSLKDNLKYRLSILDNEIQRDKDLLPFITWRKELNAEL